MQLGLTLFTVVSQDESVAFVLILKTIKGSILSGMYKSRDERNILFTSWFALQINASGSTFLNVSYFARRCGISLRNVLYSKSSNVEVHLKLK